MRKRDRSVSGPPSKVTKRDSRTLNEHSVRIMYWSTVGIPSSGTFVKLWPVEVSFVRFRTFNLVVIYSRSPLLRCCDAFCRDPPCWCPPKRLPNQSHTSQTLAIHSLSPFPTSKRLSVSCDFELLCLCR